MQIFTRHFQVFDHVLIYNVNDKKKDLNIILDKVIDNWKKNQIQLI